MVLLQCVLTSQLLIFHVAGNATNHERRCTGRKDTDVVVEARMLQSDR